MSATFLAAAATREADAQLLTAAATLDALSQDALHSLSVHLRARDVAALAAASSRTRSALHPRLLEMASEMIADMRPTIDFRLEKNVPPLGAVFERRQKLVSPVVPEAKSFGTRYVGCRLLFEPDGTVTGKFLKLIVFRAPYGEAPEGDRSCWRGRYAAYPCGAVAIFRCADCAADESFDDTDFDDAWLRGCAGVSAPLPTCTPDERDDPEWTAGRPKRWLVGEGGADEGSRLEAVEAMWRLHGELEFCSLSCELRPHFLADVLSWGTRPLGGRARGW